MFYLCRKYYGIYKYSKVSGCKICTQKSIMVLYIINEHAKNWNREALPFTITPNEILRHALNRTNVVFVEYNKILLKEYKYLNKRGVLSCSLTRRQHSKEISSPHIDLQV